MDELLKEILKEILKRYKKKQVLITVSHIMLIVVKNTEDAAKRGGWMLRVK